MTEPRWLNEVEQRHWRSYIAGSLRLYERLDRELREGHGLSMPEYEILVRLSEAPDRRIRMAELAESAHQSRSRLSHTVSRLQRAKLVSRDTCPEDRRGVFAVLTPEGMTRLREAAETHVRGVREHLVDVIDDTDFAVLGRLLQEVGDKLGTPT
ncbi:MAG: MarR family transcriptional regulator [Micromonosporaceae bacterium]|nr:MarR family transcriptional regulator [Micromonosporaceae bacterium]